MPPVYEPAEDSYLLSEQVKKYSSGKKVIDIGSGSGIQAQTALFSGAKSVLATDANPQAVKLLKEKSLNAKLSNLFSKVPPQKFDLIIFNPPYLPFDPAEDSSSALATTGGKNGDEILLKFIQQAKKFLAKNGIILVVLSSLTPQNKILKLIKKLNLKKTKLSAKKIFMEELEVWKLTPQNNNP